MSYELQEQHTFVLDENQSLREEVGELKKENSRMVELLGSVPPRNGVWVDKWGACKVCDGEIPYGHTNNCDLWKLEQEVETLKDENNRLRERVNALLQEVVRLTRLGERITELEEENLNLREMRLQDAQALARMQDHLAHLEGFTS